MTNVVKISSHDELISSISHILGFTPRGMVCLAFGDGPTARLDIPESPEEMGEFVKTLTEVYLHRYHPGRVALVAYGEDGPGCVRALAALGGALVNSEVGGPEVGPMLWVNGEEWTEVLAGTRGTVDSGVRARIDAEFALMGGVMPAGRREDLVAAMQGDPTGVAEHMPAARAHALAMSVGGRLAELEWLGSRLDEFLGDQRTFSDVDAARVLSVIHHGWARDAAETRMTREAAGVFSGLWQDLVRRAPREVRDTPAALLALSSYLWGNGARAWVALDQVSGSHPLAELVAFAVEQAIDPRELERALQLAGSGALMQQAALRDAAERKRPGHDQNTHNVPGVHVTGPSSSAPGR